jgi:hypothetical protein
MTTAALEHRDTGESTSRLRFHRYARCLSERGESAGSWPTCNGCGQRSKTAEGLNNHPHPAILTNQPTDRVVTLYRRLGSHLTYLQATQMINYLRGRQPAREVLASHHL